MYLNYSYSSITKFTLSIKAKIRVKWPTFTPFSAFFPYSMFLRMKPVSWDSHVLSPWQLDHSALSAVTSAQQRMLGNNEHFYPSQDDKDGEDEEEEEEQGRENRKEEGERDMENGRLEYLEEKEMTGGRQSWEGKGGEVVKPAAIVVGRQRVDRPLRPGNHGNRGIPYMPNIAPLHHQAANKQQYFMAAKKRAFMERSMTTVALLEDTYLTMMVFRIGIPDIKQTVGASKTLLVTCVWNSWKAEARTAVPGASWLII